MVANATGARNHRRISRRRLLKLGLQGGMVSMLSLGSCTPKPRRSGRPNVILISLDTTRLDRLSCYGYHRPTTPNLDRIAAEAMLYTKAISTSSWTLPAHATLFTGKFVSSHGARYDPEGPLRLVDGIGGPAGWRRYRARGLSKHEITLAGVLKNAGYATGSVVAGPWMKKVFGLSKGFEFYDDEEITSLNGRLANRVTKSAVAWIKDVADKPFFLFLNYFDPHGPYIPPDAFVRKLLSAEADQARAMTSKLQMANTLYDAEINYMDYYIGVLLERLRRLNLYDNTLIVVAADHGELLGEHGMTGHGKSLYQEEIHIPLFAKYPHGEVQAAQSQVRIQLTDVLPMILERVGLPNPPGIQGQSPRGLDHAIVSEVYPLQSVSQVGDSQAIYDGDFKFVLNRTNSLLFDLKSDPQESKNLFAQYPERADTMRSTLLAYLDSLPKPGASGPEQIVDPETQEALKALGYI